MKKIRKVMSKDGHAWLKKRNVTVQPGAELYSQNRENKKSFGAIYPPKDFF